MSRNRVPASFRDPSGFLFRHEGVLYRQVNSVFRDPYELMMSSGFYAAAVACGDLIAHTEVPPNTVPPDEFCYKILKPEHIPFISYPYEWSFGQLKDAGLLTLRLQKLALKFGLCMKDASAYNVQFDSGRPVFIDSLSFEPYTEGRPWVAYQQFCTHFLAPLALMAYGHVGLGRLLRVYTDGIPLDVASQLLPFRTRLRFPLWIHIHGHARSIRAHGGAPASAAKAGVPKVGKRALLGLLDSLEGALRGLEWTPEGTEWGDYYEDTNYSDEARDHKRTVIKGFIAMATPRVVWDLGANTGVFSQEAAQAGALTIAFDADPAAVEKSYRRYREAKGVSVLPILMDLTNPSPDSGWANEERSSLCKRGPADLVMALALVHHLAIGNNVPLDRIAGFLQKLCRFLIIEFIPKSDSQVQRLLRSREDVFVGYTQDRFEEAFLGHFALRERTEISDSERVLYLFERR